MRVRTAMTALEENLVSNVFVGASRHLRHARVPIITGCVAGSDPESWYQSVDISHAESSPGSAAGLALMRAHSDASPQLRPLLLVIKCLLDQHSLNKVRCYARRAVLLL